MRLASVYAHSDREAAQRPAFFRSLRNFINKSTVLGIDANCVPDVRLDVENHSRSPYNNMGADELQDIIVEKDLIDVAREWLGESGDKPFYTSFHNVPGGLTTSTRIDRIYLPNLDSMSGEHEPGVQDFFARDLDAIELDHEPAAVRVEEATGEKGKYVIRINEKIFDSEEFNSKVQNIISEVMQNERPEVSNTWRMTWVKIKIRVKEACVKETKRIGRKQTKRLKAVKFRR